MVCVVRILLPRWWKKGAEAGVRLLSPGCVKSQRE